MEKKTNIKIGFNSTVKNCSLGNYVTIKNGIFINDSKIGKFTYISHGCDINFSQIGSFCSIGKDVKCGLGKHPINFVSTHPIFFSTKKQCQITFSDKDYYTEREQVIIGNDVWIGTNSTILDGIKVGDGAIIGACSLVTKDVPPYAIVGGIPARIIRYRFDKNTINKLLKIKWWNKEISWLKNNYLDFHDISLFIKNNSYNK